MLAQRVISAVIGGAVLLALLYLGGNYALFASLVLLSVAAFEIANVSQFNRLQTAATVAVALSAFYFLLNGALFYAFLFPVIVLTFKVKEKETNIYQYLFIIYAAYGFLSLYRLSAPEKSLVPVIVPLVLVWTLDTVSYFAGMLFGKRKIAPKISPHKTVEGTLAGISAGTAAFVITMLILNPEFSIFQAIIEGVLLSIAAFLGDLIESAYKRKYGVKDSGKILPGHGGILDRFDSLLMVLTIGSILKIFWM